MARPADALHARSAQDAADVLQTDPNKGLHAEDGLLRRFDSIIGWLLAAVAVLSFALGDLAEGFAILVVLAINGAIGFSPNCGRPRQWRRC